MSHPEDTGIFEDNLMFIEQINIFINDKDDIIYVFINGIDTLDIDHVIYNIEDMKIPYEDKKNKVEIYLQYLADRHILCLSTSSKYCELWLKNEDDIVKKLSSIWERGIFGFEIERLDSGKYKCMNTPVSIRDETYYLDLIFDEEDLD